MEDAQAEADAAGLGSELPADEGLAKLQRLSCSFRLCCVCGRSFKAPPSNGAEATTQSYEGTCQAGRPECIETVQGDGSVNLELTTSSASCTHGASPRA